MLANCPQYPSIARSLSLSIHYCTRQLGGGGLKKEVKNWSYKNISKINEIWSWIE